MKISTNFFDIIILLGAIQGFIISALLYFSKEKTYSHKILAALILLISLACLNIFLMDTGIRYSSVVANILAAIVPLIIVMPIGPLIYFYVRSSLHPGFKLSQPDRKHFYTIFLDVVPELVALIYIVGVLTRVINQSYQPTVSNFIDTWNTYVDIPRWISASSYILFTIRLLRDTDSQKVDANILSWLRQFVYVFAGFQLIWLLHLVPYVMPNTSDYLIEKFGWYPLYIPLAVIVYWLGVNGLLVKRAEQKVVGKPIDEELAKSATETLIKSMTESRLFLNPLLSLNLLAEQTGLAPKLISAVVNQHVGSSFNEFVNRYRVEEVKIRLLDSSYSHLTITGIAYECGFNSQATFQRTFKSFTGLSPKEFQSQKVLKSA